MTAFYNVQKKSKEPKFYFDDGAGDTLAIWGLLAGIALAGAVIVSLWASGLGMFSMLETVFRYYGIYVLAALAVIVGGTLAFAAFDTKPFVLSVVILVAGVALSGYALAVHPYIVKSVYASEMQEVDETTDYNERAPWVVANAFSQRGQGDIRGDIRPVRYVPTASVEEGDKSRYSAAVVERRIFRAGYEAVQVMDMPYSGSAPSGAVQHCEMPDSMNKRLDSPWPWASLNWTLHRKTPFLAHFNSADAYAYCNADNKPVIVVPLVKYSGIWRVTMEPAGVFVYDENGGRYLTADEANEEGIDGATYPMEVARKQREAMKAGGSLTQYYSSVYGYDTTEKDVEDANGTNASEFILTKEDGSVSFVTPLVPRGTSQSIVAVSDVPGRQEGSGRLPITVNTSPNLQSSTSTIETKIRESSVKGDVEWTTRWASGMTVYEILPSHDGWWSASVGQGQAVSYRADISPEGDVTVHRTDGDNADSNPDTSSESVTVSGDKPLSEMTEADLYDLIDQAVEELKSRE